MPRTAKPIPAGHDNTRHLSVGVLALCLPMGKVQRVLESCGKSGKRVRDLPAAVVAYYVIALSLFPSSAYESVLNWLLCGLSWLRRNPLRNSTKAAISRARAKLGEAPLRQIFHELAAPLAATPSKGSLFKGMRVVALDGSCLALQDTKANAKAFGRSRNQHGPGAYPIARFVLLADVGTHLVVNAEIGPYEESELALAEKILGSLQKGMVCLADRFFPTPAFWTKAEGTGAHLVWRAKTFVKLRHVKALPDGSWLAEWRPSDRALGPVTVRVVEYRVGASGETIRLLTTILDPEAATALELAGLYPQRWEIELTIRESKTVMRDGLPTLRSKLPELVRQEFWGLLLAHQIVRRMMAQAAHENGLDPDRLSFKGALEIVRIAQTGPVLSFSPSAKGGVLA